LGKHLHNRFDYADKKSFLTLLPGQPNVIYIFCSVIKFNSLQLTRFLKEQSLISTKAQVHVGEPPDRVISLGMPLRKFEQPSPPPFTGGTF
jgi:hypothetical protein